MKRNCRLVAYCGDECIMMGCKLTKPEAKELKRKRISQGISPDMLFIDEYTKKDYKPIFTNAWRVKVIFRSAKYDYLNGKGNESRVVDREKSIIVGQSLTHNEAKGLHKLASSIYNKTVDIVMEMYAHQEIELHFDCDNTHILEDLESKDIKLNGKGLKKKVTDNLSYTVLGHSVDKDSRWVDGQIDFTSYNLSSDTGKSIDIPCINPYQSHCGFTTLPKQKVSKLDDGRGASYLKGARHELSYSQFISLLQSMRNDSHYLSMFKYLRRSLFIRNAKGGNPIDALFCINEKIYIDKKGKPKQGYIKAPRKFIQQLIDRTV